MIPPNPEPRTLNPVCPGASLLIGLLTALVATIALAQPWQTAIDIGGRYDHPYLRQFHGAEYSEEHQVNFRWTRPGSALVLPGAGRVAPLILRIHGDEAGQTIRIDAGSGAFTLPLRVGWQRVLVLPDTAGGYRGSGDILISIAAPTRVSEADPRERGVVIASVVLKGRGGGAPAQAMLIGLSAALATLLVGWSLRRVWRGVLAGSVLAAGMLAVLLLEQGAWRLMLTSYTGRLVLVLACGGVVAWASAYLLRLLDTRGIVAMETRWRRGLAAAALLAFVLRFGAMAYPLNFISDIRFSMARATMVREGELADLFFPNPSLTPVQWETDATIPRSPFYYILTAPLTALPGNGDRLAMMAFSSAVDALAVLLVGVLTRLAGVGGRAAVLGALLAGVSHFGLLAAASWGLFPTLLAQCLVLLAMAVWAWIIPHLHRRWAGGVLTTVLALAYLAYPTGLLFLGLTWGITLLLLAIQRRAAVFKFSLLAGMLAAGLALLFFYGWHIPAMFNTTLPLLAVRLGEQAPGGGGDPLSVWDIVNPIWLPLYAKFGSFVLTVAAGGGLLLARPTPDSRAHHMRTLLLAWLLTYPLLALASAYVVTFIVKDVLYMLPALAVLSGVFLGRVSRYRWGGAVAAALLLLVLWQGGLALLQAIVYAFSELK